MDVTALDIIDGLQQYEVNRIVADVELSFERGVPYMTLTVKFYQTLP